MFVPMIAGIFPPPDQVASLCSRRNRRMPRTASNPYVSPPVRRSAWRSMNVFPRSDAAVSYVPGQPPRASAKAMAGGLIRTTVVPVRRRKSCAWPTRTPRMAVNVSFAAIDFPSEFAAPLGPYLTHLRGRSKGWVLRREVLKVEAHAAGLQLRDDQAWRQLFRRQDTGSRNLLSVDQHHRSRGRRGGQESFRRPAAAPIRLPRLHREGGPHSSLLPTHLPSPHLDDDSERPGQWADQRRRLGDRREERVPERKLRGTHPDDVRGVQQAEGVERVDRPDEFRVDVVLVVRPSDPFAEAGRQREHLFVAEQMHPSGADRRREGAVLFSAHGLLLGEVPPVPAPRVRQRDPEEKCTTAP